MFASTNYLNELDKRNWIIILKVQVKCQNLPALLNYPPLKKPSQILKYYSLFLLIYLILKRHLNLWFLPESEYLEVKLCNFKGKLKCLFANLKEWLKRNCPNHLSCQRNQTCSRLFKSLKKSKSLCSNLQLIWINLRIGWPLISINSFTLLKKPRPNWALW